MSITLKLLMAGATIVSSASFSTTFAGKEESEELRILKAKLALAQAEAEKSKAEAEKAKLCAGQKTFGSVGDADSGFSVKFEGIAEATPPEEVDWKMRSLKGSTGNVTIYVDSKDMPTEVYVIGVAAIPTTMNAVRAEQFAHRQAEMQAKASFAIWMKESFSVSVGMTNKTLVITTGDSAKQGPPHEASEDRMMTQENATQLASATWRGMRCWKVFQEAEKSKRVEVWRWSVKEQELARIVEILTRDGDPEAAKRKQYMKIDSYEL